MGLEAAWQLREIESTEDLSRFIQTHLSQSGRASLPFVNSAFQQTHPFAELDALCDAFLSNHVANRGSRAQGKAFALATGQAFDRITLAQFRAAALKEKWPCHFAPTFGSVLRELQITHEMCVRLFLFMSLRGLIGAAIRLGIVGPMQAQELQVELNPHAESIAASCASLGLDQLTQTSPLLEVFQGAHDRLYSTLFQT
jgi:urease accessory protein